MEQYFRAEVREQVITIDLFYNEEEHCIEIENDFEDSWHDVVIEGEDKTVNVYVDDETDKLNVTIYDEVEGVLGNAEFIECDDIMGGELIRKLVTTPKTDFTLEFTVKELEKMLSMVKNAKDPVNNVYGVSIENQDAPNCSTPDTYTINIRVSK